MKWVTFLLSFLTLLQCNKTSDFIAIDSQENEPPYTEVGLYEFTITGYKNIKADWKLSAKRAFVLNGSGEIQIFNVDIQLYEKNNNTTITSEKGYYDKEKKLIRLQDNVVVKAGNGKSLYSNLLNWDEMSQRLYTDSPITIKFPEGDIINGVGMVADKKLDKVIIKKSTGYHPAQK